MSEPVEVRIGAASSSEIGPDSSALGREARSVAGGSIEQALALAGEWGRRIPLPGRGRTAERWELLATAGAADLSVARVLEPHADALAILDEAGAAEPPAGSTWGVYAAEGPGVRLSAELVGGPVDGPMEGPVDGQVEGSWSLSGTKPWCSLAGEVSHALVTAWVADDARGLFAVALRDSPGAVVDDVAWVSRGLTSIRSGPVSFTDVRAVPVGAPSWYLRRDGFAWGGMGVAAIWFGAGVALGQRLRSSLRHREPDQIALTHLGAVDVALAGARSVLEQAAAAIDAGEASGRHGELLALQVRGVVADAVERVLHHVDHALGPGPLTRDEEHARRVADLRVYVRQHHGERDHAALGRMLWRRSTESSSDE